MAGPAKPLRFSTAALCAVLRAQNLGEPHITLRDSAMWFPPEERRAVADAAWSEFAEQGLLDKRGRLTDEVADWLPLLVTARREFYGWVTVGNETTALLVAVTDNDALLAASQHDEVRIVGVPAENPAETLLAELPPAGVPHGQSISVYRSDLPGYGGSATGGAVIRNRATAVRPEVERFVKLAQEPATALGELYVAVRGHLGRRKSLAEPIRFRDTAEGRRMISVENEFISVIPATPRLMTDRLYEAARHLAT